MYPYNVHIFIEWATDEENKRARKAKPQKYAARNLRAVEELFEHNCNAVVNNKLTNVRRLEVKQGRKVLFMQRFEDGRRL